MDQTVLRRIAAGDPAAVNDCIDRYGALVWSLARRHLRQHADAEDAVQEIFIEIWRNAARFDPGIASEATFITMISRRRLIDRYLKVLLPAQEEVGRMWQEDEINVAEEHFATATAKMIMSQLRSCASVRASNGKTLLASAVAGNHHDIGLQAVAEFFEMDGWRVIQLGSDVPIRDLVEAVGFYQADLLGLSVSLRTQLATLKQTIEGVRRSERGAVVKILVGGRGLTGTSDLVAEFGADGYAADPSQAVVVGNALVEMGSEDPTGEDASKGAASAEG